MKKILIIDTSDVGAAYTAEAIKTLGFEPLFLINLDDFQGNTVSEVKQYPHIDVDTKLLNELINAVDQNEITNIAGVFTALDSKLAIAVKLARHLNVNGLPAELISLSNKNTVYDLISEHCPPSVALVKGDIKKYRAFIEVLCQQHQTLILKPSNAAGGIGVKIFSSPIDEADLVKHISSFNFNEWQLMAFVPGDLVSLEGYILNGQCTFLGLTSRSKIGNTESYFTFPIDDSLPASIVVNAQEAIFALVKASSFKNGYFHSEFIMSHDQAYLIDANFGRIGGGPLIDLISYSYGITPIAIMKHIIHLSLFSKEKNALSPYQTITKKEAAGASYGIKESATLLDIELPEIPDGIKHTQLLNNHSIVPEMGANNWSWVGLVSGPKNSVTEFMSRMQIKTNKGIFPPCYL